MILAVPTFVNAIRSTFIDMIIIYRSEEDNNNDTTVDTAGRVNGAAGKMTKTSDGTRSERANSPKNAETLHSSQESNDRMNTLRSMASMRSRIKTCESLAFAHSNNVAHPMVDPVVEFKSMTSALSQALSRALTVGSNRASQSDEDKLNQSKSVSSKKSNETVPSNVQKRIVSNASIDDIG